MNLEKGQFGLVWNYNDMLHTVNLGGGGSAFYLYDANKQRSRKQIFNKSGKLVEDRIYLEGFEIYRHYVSSANPDEVIETHHVFADSQRVVIVENVKQTYNNHLPIGTLYRYQYSNHLGSACLELNETAAVISYEEYHPYGTTAYQLTNKAINIIAKRYRYTGMERDEESGLEYHSARYYLPWLGRWLSADPIGIGGGGNLYGYSECNCICFSDKLGLQAQDSGLWNGFSKPGGYIENWSEFEFWENGKKYKGSAPGELPDVFDLGIQKRWWERVAWRTNPRPKADQKQDDTLSQPPMVQADVKKSVLIWKFDPITITGRIPKSEFTPPIPNPAPSPYHPKTPIKNIPIPTKLESFLDYMKHDFILRPEKESLPLIKEGYGAIADGFEAAGLPELAVPFEVGAKSADVSILFIDLSTEDQGQTIEHGGKELIKRTKPVKRLVEELIKRKLPSFPEPIRKKIAEELEKLFEEKADEGLKEIRKRMEENDPEMKKSLEEIFEEWLKKNPLSQ